MRLLDPARDRWTNIVLSVLRVAAALVYMQHGSQKLFGFPPSGAPGPVAPLVLVSLTGVAGILEFFGGMLLLVGLFTRPVAFILSGEMAVAYFHVHAPRAFLPIVNRGELISCGPIDSLRRQAELDGSLEEVFLKLTKEFDAEPMPVP